MPRSASGVYTLPLPPVVPGTIITADWANQTLADMAQALTDSLDRQGRGGMNAPLRVDGGTALQPGFSFNESPSSGMFTSDPQTLQFSVLGVERGSFSSTRFTTTVPVGIVNGTAVLPAYGFSAQSNMGMWRGGTDVLSFATQGVDRMSIGANSQILFGNRATDTAGTASAVFNRVRQVTAAADQIGFHENSMFASAGITGGRGINIASRFEAGTYVTTTYSGMQVNDATLGGAGHSVTNSRGVLVSNFNNFTGNHRGLDLRTDTAATKWAVHAGGGAQSWFSGRVGIGEGAESPTTNLQVAASQASSASIQVQNDLAVANASAAFQARIAGGNAVNLQANPAGSTGQPVTGGALGAGLFTTSGLTAGLALGTTAGPIRFFSESVSVERMRLDGPNLGIGTAAPAGLLHVQGTTDALARMRLQNAGGAAPSVIDQTTGGLELFAAGMNTTNRYTPSLRFGSTDPDFTTTNPKTMAAIVGYATQTFSADGTSGMGLEFFTSPNSQVTPVLQSRMTIDQNGNVDIPGTFRVSTGEVTSGTFAPTGFAGTNVSALTVSEVQWMRVGNVVTVSGQVTPTFTAAANTASTWTMTLPVPSALGFVRRLAGTAAAQGSTFSTPAAVFADTANNRASFRCLATATGAVGFSFHYTYLIL